MKWHDPLGASDEKTGGAILAEECSWFALGGATMFKTRKLRSAKSLSSQRRLPERLQHPGLLIIIVVHCGFSRQLDTKEHQTWFVFYLNFGELKFVMTWFHVG